jgi:PadR family transcriptional regulator PadR
MGDELELLRGTLDLMILRALSGEERHGYGVAEWIRSRTGGELVVEDAALYKALHRLEHRGQVSSDWGVSENNRRAKYYSLTEAGRRQLEAERATWRRYSAALDRLLA